VRSANGFHLFKLVVRIPAHPDRRFRPIVITYSEAS
jgi:hypothetical protein